MELDLIICDESSRIKNPQARQSKALHRLGAKARFRLILTGTPVQNNPLDFYSQYKFLDASIFGKSFYAFRARYAVMGGYGNHQIIACRYLDELVEKTHAIAELSAGTVTAANILTRLLRLSHVMGGFVRANDSVRVRQVSTAKLDALEETITDVLEEGNKLVVFARFLPELDAIRELLRRLCIGHAEISAR